MGRHASLGALFHRQERCAFTACCSSMGEVFHGLPPCSGHLPPGERASAYGVVVHLEERQPEVPVSPHEDRVGEFKKEPDGELPSKKFRAQKRNSPPLSTCR